MDDLVHGDGDDHGERRQRRRRPGSPDAYSTSRGQRLNRRQRTQGVLANDTDVEGATLGAALVNPPSHGTLGAFDTDDGGFRYLPAANYVGTDTFTYKATEGALRSAETTVTITITPVNDLPVAVADSASTPEDTAARDGGSGAHGQRHATWRRPTRTWSPPWSPAPPMARGRQRRRLLHLHARARTTRASTASPIASRTPMGRSVSTRPPSRSRSRRPTTRRSRSPMDARRTRTSCSTAASVLGNDVDRRRRDHPHGGARHAAGARGRSSSTPMAPSPTRRSLNDNGSVTFDYHATDGTSASNTVSVTITIVPVNDAPVAVADSGTTAEDTLLSVVAPGLKANDTDVDVDDHQPDRVALDAGRPRYGDGQRERLMELHTSCELQRIRQLHLPGLRRRGLLVAGAR